MSRFRVSRMAAMLVSFVGWLVAALCVFTILYTSLFSPVQFATVKLLAPGFAIFISVGTFFGLLGSMARAVFDIAEASRRDSSTRTSAT